MTGRRRAAAALAAALIAAATAGCTQVAQLRPVAGGEITAVRTATNIVLVQQEVTLDVAPVCEFTDPTYTCTGSTDTGAEVRSTAQVVAPYGATTDQWGAGSPAEITLVVEVAGAPIYTGTVQDALVSQGQS